MPIIEGYKANLWLEESRSGRQTNDTCTCVVVEVPWAAISLLALGN